MKYQDKSSSNTQTHKSFEEKYILIYVFSLHSRGNKFNTTAMHTTKCDTGITLSEDKQVDSHSNDLVLKGDISWTLLRVLLTHCLR